MIVMLVSVHCSLVVTCWERAYLLVLFFVMFSSVFVSFLCGVLGQVYFLSLEYQLSVAICPEAMALCEIQIFRLPLCFVISKQFGLLMALKRFASFSFHVAGYDNNRLSI